jgi:predicted RNA-binding protein with PUA-like domain
MQYWLMKSEPEAFSFDDLVKDGMTVWDGVRNYAARNFMRAMEVGDKVLFYHSMSDKAIVGIAEVSKTHFQDPTDDTDTWSSVEIVPVRLLKNPVTLKQVKSDGALEGLLLIKLSRLSVTPVEKVHYDYILKLSEN